MDMELLFLILKTAGILLLILLGIILLAVILLLIYPIRYKGTGTLKEGWKLEGNVSVTWLMHLLHFQLEYKNGLCWKISLAGIPVWPRNRKKRTKRTASNKGEKTLQEKTERTELQEGAAPAVSVLPAESEEAIAPNAAQEIKQKMPVSAIADEDRGIQTASEKKKRFSYRMKEKLRKWLCSLQRLFRRIKKAASDLRGALEHAAARAEEVRKICRYYAKLLTSEETKALLRKAFYHIRKLWMHIKPRTLEGSFEVGTGEPASTANVLAVWGMLYPVLGENISLVPDFEKARAEGYLYIRGRICACIVLYHTLKLLLDKKNQEFIRQLRRRK